MTLWLLLFAISSVVAVPSGFIEGRKGGILGAIIGLIVGSMVMIAWFCGLLAGKSCLDKHLNRVKPGFGAVVAVSMGYFLVVASSLGSFHLSRLATRWLVSLIAR